MMLFYQLRLNGRPCGDYPTLEEALQRVKAALSADLDLEPEIIDRRTGRASMLCSSKRWRDEISQHLGY